jgi:26S proteasome regulatory subunit N2
MIATASAPMVASSSASLSVSTASGYIALLQEDDPVLQQHALQKLLQCVDSLWHQVAECLPQLEAMAETKSSELAPLAAAVASRVFFYLEEPSSALRLALEAGPDYFDWDRATCDSASSRSSSKSPYVERLVAAALDAYRAAKTRADLGTAAVEDNSNNNLSVEQLQPMVYRLLERSCQAGHYEHALGMALEAHEPAQVERILLASGPSDSLLQYALKAAVTVVSAKAFRVQTLQVIAKCRQGQLTQGLTNAACDLVVTHQLLRESQPVAQVLEKLLNGSEHDYLLALQLAFDLMDSGDQAFVQSVAADLTASTSSNSSSENELYQQRLQQLNRVLVRGFSSELALSFLHKHNKADRLIVETLKKTLEERSSGSRSSILHHAAIISHGYLYAGTTNDSFLRENLDWMKKASNWYVKMLRW